jgi:hypothetical protein
MLTQKRLKECLSYSPETGVFKWIGPNNKRPGTIDRKGYLRIGIDYKVYRAHRLAFLYMTGDIPKEVDHIDLDTSNDRWNNLRACTNTQNQANRGPRKTNTSGVKGVSWHKRIKMWQSSISKDYKKLHLGYFDDINDASAAYNKAAKSMHGEFAK